MPYSLLCYIAYVLYSTGQGVICIRCYIASSGYMATTKVPDAAATAQCEPRRSHPHLMYTVAMPPFPGPGAGDRSTSTLLSLPHP